MTEARSALSGRVAIVTGGGSGLGMAIALEFAAVGAHVVVTDIRSAEADQVAARIVGEGGTATAIACDVRDRENVDRLTADTVRNHGRLDILVNSAGLAILGGALDLTDEDWKKTLDVNLTGTFYTSRAAARHMVKAGYGRIINLASIAGQRAGHGRTAYGVSKGGVIMLTRNMAVELAPLGVTVNALAPGPIDTPLLLGHGPTTKEAYMRVLPMGRYGRPDEVAAAALFLASERASYITGHILNVDGGFGAAGLMDGLHIDNGAA